MTRVKETRERWEQMEEAGEDFESWLKHGLKTPTKPKPSKTLKNAVLKKRGRSNECLRNGRKSELRKGGLPGSEFWKSSEYKIHMSGAELLKYPFIYSI